MPPFSREYRLIKKSDFQSVLKKSNKVSHKYLLALSIPNQLNHARLGIIIAKNKVKLAVHRNQLRRIVRESFRHHPIVLKKLDIVVLMRSHWPALDIQTMRMDVDCLWKKVMES